MVTTDAETGKELERCELVKGYEFRKNQYLLLTDDDLDRLLTDITVRADCEHASTRTTSDGLFLTRCAVGAAVAGGCPRDCVRFEKRHVGGIGLGVGG